MPEIIALIIFILSLAGIGIILYGKISLLLELPETSPPQFDLKNILLKIKTTTPLKGFSGDIILQRILSKIRILTLKTDSQTFNWLQKLRQRAQKKKFGENDHYWQEIKKSTKE